LGLFLTEDSPAQDFATQRARMVSEIEAMYAETRSETGLARMSPAVRDAMGKVERHRLVGPDQRGVAYRNHPLPIGSGQTISQPYIVALSTDLLGLKGGESVLDIGTGSGYQAAVLAEIAARVYSIEILPSLAEGARKRLEDLRYGNIEIKVGDGYQGWYEKSPFDAIVVAAAAPQIPQALVDQLKPGGRMVIPVGGSGEIQYLKLLTKRADGGVDERRVLPVRFVPLVPGAR
jgi:protein-L-isoaspartate(D-aspartate) O-methyltransferase